MRTLVRAGRLLRFDVEGVRHAIAIDWPIDRGAPPCCAHHHEPDVGTCCARCPYWTGKVAS